MMVFCSFLVNQISPDSLTFIFRSTDHYFEYKAYEEVTVWRFVFNLL